MGGILVADVTTNLVNPASNAVPSLSVPVMPGGQAPERTEGGAFTDFTEQII